MQNAYNILSFILIVLLLIFSLTNKNTVEVIRVETKVDTVTIINFDTVYQTKYIALKPNVQEPIKDTLYIDSTQQKLAVNVYDNEVKDSLLSLKYKISTTGSIIDFDLKYKILSPLTITKYVDKTITKETIKTLTPKGIYLGINLNSNLDFTPNISYLKGNWAFEYGYSVINKTHSLGVKKRLKIF